jgi:hypothetical protein
MSAANMTYDSLVEDVIKYAERNDESFVTQIPRLIMLTEQSIAAEIKTLLQLNVVDTTIAAGDSTVEKPVRWRKTTSMKINGVPVLNRSMDYVTQYLSEAPAGQPLYYAEYDYDHWGFAPAADQNYPVEIIYYSRIQPLDITNQENLLTREAPQALLYGTLLQAQGFLKNTEKLAVWKQYYTDAINALKGEDASRMVDRNASRQESQS